MTSLSQWDEHIVEDNSDNKATNLPVSTHFSSAALNKFWTISPPQADVLSQPLGTI